MCPVTDAQDLADRKDLRSKTVQGPLKQAEVMDVGSFRDLIRHIVRDCEYPVAAGEEFPQGLTALESQAVADFGPDDLLVGAKRRFELVRDDGAWTLSLHTPHTEQIRSRSERRRTKRLLENVDP